jgi:hypothetical protein
MAAVRPAPRSISLTRDRDKPSRSASWAWVIRRRRRVVRTSRPSVRARLRDSRSPSTSAAPRRPGMSAASL